MNENEQHLQNELDHVRSEWQKETNRAMRVISMLQRRAKEELDGKGEAWKLKFDALMDACHEALGILETK